MNADEIPLAARRKVYVLCTQERGPDTVDQRKGFANCDVCGLPPLSWGDMPVGIGSTTHGSEVVSGLSAPPPCGSQPGRAAHLSFPDPLKDQRSDGRLPRPATSPNRGSQPTATIHFLQSGHPGRVPSQHAQADNRQTKGSMPLDNRPTWTIRRKRQEEMT